ncbi:MAG: phospho-N-acetylmuramoyl-pentapeptide-transferase [Firmicutes bacterium]|jgi:phospho-N-acetylmuramoyl-pentapeptide-transferase|nr:phospho-N-acetylmuramoyl-pentapeptide-transferase [Bacillota bacterium]HOB22100.1 phospho-N-acetylmuramoyl-pentapeptide-transferase [Bacillota bacterium]HQD39055.1 phospho-N-acetylmuramoyl-pentapeptide-transferase [Bacillota bacterium]
MWLLPVYSALVAFVLVLAAGPVVIRFLVRLGTGQNVRDDGPQTHLKKAGTPSMGGIMILIPLALAAIIVSPTKEILPYMLFVTLGFGLVGLVDDFLKVVRGRSLGLRARDKLLGQILVGAVAILFVLSRPDLGSSVFVPLAGTRLSLPKWLYFVFAELVLIATSNAVNLTDGLDGLAAGSMTATAISYVAITALLGSWELAVFAGALAGACLGFSWFNAPPAQVFMGDTGSLALGGALGTMALLTKTELFLPILGGLYLVEALSVILQVISFQLTGKRIFRMSPLHHHFELAGWAEPKVAARFTLASVLCGVLGLLAFVYTFF